VAVLTLEEASVLIQNEWRKTGRDAESDDSNFIKLIKRLCVDSIDERNRLDSVTVEDDESEARKEQPPLGEELLLSLQDLMLRRKTPSDDHAKDVKDTQRGQDPTATANEVMQKSIPLMHEVMLAESGIAMFSSQKLTLKTGSEDSTETRVHASAPSSTASHVSDEFLNSSFAFHQFDCHSDCTESTGTEGVVTQLHSSIVFNRRRLRSGDTVCSEISCSEGWEANSSLFGREKGGPQSQSQAQSQAQAQAQSYILPSLSEASSPPVPRRPETIPEAKEAWESSFNQSCSSGAATINNMMSQSRDYPDAAVGVEDRQEIAMACSISSLASSIHIHSAPLSPAEAWREGDEEAAGREDALLGRCLHSAIVSRALPASELGVHRPDVTSPRAPAPVHSDMAEVAREDPSDLSEKTTSPNVTTAPASPDKHSTSPAAHKSSPGSHDAVEESAVCLDVLVLPTMLPAPVKNMIYAALGVLQVDVRRAHR
jgi:hypothetical protein